MSDRSMTFTPVTWALGVLRLFSPLQPRRARETRRSVIDFTGRFLRARPVSPREKHDNRAKGLEHELEPGVNDAPANHPAVSKLQTCSQTRRSLTAGSQGFSRGRLELRHRRPQHLLPPPRGVNRDD